MKPGLHNPAKVLGLGTDLFDDFVFVGKLSGFFFGINPFSIDINLVYPAFGGNDLQRGNILPEIKQLGRQTDGTGCVVSSCAVFDTYRYTHGRVS